MTEKVVEEQEKVEEKKPTQKSNMALFRELCKYEDKEFLLSLVNQSLLESSGANLFVQAIRHCFKDILKLFNIEVKSFRSDLYVIFNEENQEFTKEKHEMIEQSRKALYEDEEFSINDWKCLVHFQKFLEKFVIAINQQIVHYSNLKENSKFSREEYLKLKTNLRFLI